MTLRNLLTCSLAATLVACVSPQREDPPPVTASSAPTATATPVPPDAPAAPEASTPTVSGALPLGAAVVYRATQLDAVKWIQDGGGPETLTPAEGAVFVVVSFPEATKVSYTSTEVALTPEGGAALAPLAVTSPTANPIQPRSDDYPGPAKFQRDVYMFVDWEPGPNTPFAIAFEAPSGAGSGTLKMGEAQAAITW